MNKIIFSLALFCTLLMLNGCESEESPEKLLRALMEKNVTEQFMESKEFKPGRDFEYALNKLSGNPILTFEKDDESWDGSYWNSNDYLIVTILHSEPLSAWNYTTGLFKLNANKKWEPLFSEELVPGKIDTLIDLNKDGSLEVLVDEYNHYSSGETNFKVLYAAQQNEKVQRIDIVTRDTYFEGFGATLDQPRLFSKLGYLDKGNVISLSVESKAIWFEWDENGQPVEKSKVTSSLIHWEPPQLIRELAKQTELDNSLEGVKVKLLGSNDFTEMLNFSEGLIAVKNEAGWGFVDVEGNLVIACQYPAVSSFANGRAVVNAGGDSEDWRDAYQYIDDKGNSWGKFFVSLQGKSDCETIQLVGSNVDGERNATYNLSNCPDGVMAYEYWGWEWGNKITYYPSTTIKSVIDQLANTKHEHAAIFKKFTGEPSEFKEGDSVVKFLVKKSGDDTLDEVSVSILSEYQGADYVFSIDNGGVLVRMNHGS